MPILCVDVFKMTLIGKYTDLEKVNGSVISTEVAPLFAKVNDAEKFTLLPSLKYPALCDEIEVNPDTFEVVRV